MKADETTLWSLYSKGDRVECVARLLPRGIEERVVWNGQLMSSFLFTSDSELQAWAQEKRAEYMGKGWVDVDDGSSTEIPH